MERLQSVISLRAADTSGESSYCFGAASLVKKIRAALVVVAEWLERGLVH